MFISPKKLRTRPLLFRGLSSVLLVSLVFSVGVGFNSLNYSSLQTKSDVMTCSHQRISCVLHGHRFGCYQRFGPTYGPNLLQQFRTEGDVGYLGALFSFKPEVVQAYLFLFLFCRLLLLSYSKLSMIFCSFRRYDAVLNIFVS